MQPLTNSYRKGLILSLGSVIQTQVDLYAVVPSSKGTGLHRMCPTHKQQLKQVNQCPEGPHEVGYGEWVMGNDTGATLVIAPTTARPAKQKDLSLELTPIPATEVEANTFDGQSIYYLAPSAPSVQAWLALKSIVDAGEIALVTKGTLKQGSEKMYRLITFRDYLALREIVFPEDIRQTPEAPADILEPGTFDLVMQFVNNLTASWSDLDTVNRSREELIRWIEQGETITAEIEATDNQAAAESLIEQLKTAVINQTS